MYASISELSALKNEVDRLTNLLSKCNLAQAPLFSLGSTPTAKLNE